MGEDHDKFAHLIDCAADARAGYPLWKHSLLHAYVACLSWDDLTDASVAFLDGPASLRGALRNRLVRLADRSATPAQLEKLIVRLLDLRPPGRLSRTTLDTLLSALYAKLPAAARRAVLDRWVDTGKSSTAARWLKAMADDELLFDGHAILAYWRSTGDWRAAKVLAYKADTHILSEILPELVRSVGEGWIISKAALRAGGLVEEDWDHVQEAFPASYLCLCAMLKRNVGAAEAIELVRRAGGEFDGQRGLAIWALGEMRLVGALDVLREMEDEFRADDLATLGIEANE